jgi:excisionase family DNA binding protein
MLQQEDTVLAVGMSEAARRLGLSPRTVATLVSRRQLRSRKVGRRRIIPVSALEVFVRGGHTNIRAPKEKSVGRSSASEE